MGCKVQVLVLLIIILSSFLNFTYYGVNGISLDPNDKLLSSCPKGVFYTHLQRQICPGKQEQFHCLPSYLNSPTPTLLGFITVCRPPVWFVKGTYPVYYKGIVTAFNCPLNRYQPSRNYQSNTPNMYMCPMEKTRCSEEGQSTLLLNSTDSNDLCFCMEGYILLEPCTNGTYCDQETEDCTCIGKESRNITGQADDPSVTNEPEREYDKKEREYDKKEREYDKKKRHSMTNTVIIAMVCLILLCIIVEIIVYLLRLRCPKCKISSSDNECTEKADQINGVETCGIDTKIASSVLDHTSPLITQPTQETNVVPVGHQYDVTTCDDLPKMESGTKPVKKTHD